MLKIERNKGKNQEKTKRKTENKKREMRARFAPVPFHCGPPLRVCHVAAPCGRGGARLVVF